MKPAAADTGPTVTSPVAVYAENLLTSGPVSAPAAPVGRTAADRPADLIQPTTTTKGALARLTHSQIESGDLDAMERETLRAYATALGGHLDVTISVGPRSVKVA
ncbi:hypothetical protein Plo01_28540 [Planobispora longispora]|uniref:Uncharacterized protein n=1 Tax=Planobispora longispora TaxID=28887 RepID=A0A8J3RK72_9ACTN|nr:hypothetical protein GCM10020093_044180 [Planobispora longispora]GIH76425.1 hypothetical protein Plo01_28540 [Planobispora longispora]